MDIAISQFKLNNISEGKKLIDEATIKLPQLSASEVMPLSKYYRALSEYRKVKLNS